MKRVARLAANAIVPLCTSYKSSIKSNGYGTQNSVGIRRYAFGNAELVSYSNVFA